MNSKYIKTVFDEAEQDFPNASTEFLLEAVATRLGIDCSDVAEGLRNELSEKTL
jgi:hypothetical protein